VTAGHAPLATLSTRPSGRQAGDPATPAGSDGSAIGPESGPPGRRGRCSALSAARRRTRRRRPPPRPPRRSSPPVHASRPRCREASSSTRSARSRGARSPARTSRVTDVVLVERVDADRRVGDERRGRRGVPSRAATSRTAASGRLAAAQASARRDRDEGDRHRQASAAATRTEHMVRHLCPHRARPSARTRVAEYLRSSPASAARARRPSGTRRPADGGRPAPDPGLGRGNTARSIPCAFLSTATTRPAASDAAASTGTKSRKHAWPF